MYVYVKKYIAILLYRDSDETDVDTIKWTLGPVIISIDKQPPPRQLPPFSYPEGPSPRTKDAKTPMQTRILQLFLTTAILDSIVQQIHAILCSTERQDSGVLCTGIDGICRSQYCYGHATFTSSEGLLVHQSHFVNTMVSICHVNRSLLGNFEVYSFGRLRSLIQDQTSC